MKNVTVTLPLVEFEKLREQAGDSDVDDSETTLSKNCEYVSLLIEDVANDVVSIKDAPEYDFFKTRSGKIVLENIGLFK